MPYHFFGQWNNERNPTFRNNHTKEFLRNNLLEADTTSSFPNVFGEILKSLDDRFEHRLQWLVLRSIHPRQSPDTAGFWINLVFETTFEHKPVQVGERCPCCQHITFFYCFRSINQIGNMDNRRHLI